MPGDDEAKVRAERAQAIGMFRYQLIREAHIGRHSHPKAKPETPTEPPKPSGIDYAQLIETAHAAELARGVNYAALTGASDQIPGQLDLLTGEEV
jgi:hypothetical protein